MSSEVLSALKGDFLEKKNMIGFDLRSHAPLFGFAVTRKGVLNHPLTQFGKLHTLCPCRHGQQAGFGHARQCIHFQQISLIPIQHDIHSPVSFAAQGLESTQRQGLTMPR